MNDSEVMLRLLISMHVCARPVGVVVELKTVRRPCSMA
jgi:hypothetical protein